MRSEVQRSLVAVGCEFEIADDHAGVAELGVQLGNHLAANTVGLSEFDSAGEGRNRFHKAAAGIVILTGKELLGDRRCWGVGGIGEGSKGGKGHWKPARKKSRLTMTVGGKQSASNDAAR
jgi:hypothetical protein